MSINLKIFQITDKKFYSDYVEFSLNNLINYSGGSENKVCCVNQHPFNNIKIGEYLGINTATFYVAKSPSQIWSDTNAIAKVVYRPNGWYHKEVINDPNFEHGWVKDGD